MGFSTGYATRYTYGQIRTMLDAPKNARERRGEIANNTVARLEGETVVIRLWSTDILSMRADGTGQFLSDYNSVLTRGRLNSYLPQAWNGRWSVSSLSYKYAPRKYDHISMVRANDGFYFPMMRGVEYGWDTRKCPDLENLMLGMRSGDVHASRAFAAFCRSQGWEDFARCVESIAGKPYGERPRVTARAWREICNEPAATIEVNGAIYSTGRWFANPLTGRLDRPVSRADVLLWGVDPSANEARFNGQWRRIVDQSGARKIPGLKGMFAAGFCPSLDSARGVVTF